MQDRSRGPRAATRDRTIGGKKVNIGSQSGKGLPLCLHVNDLRYDIIFEAMQALSKLAPIWGKTKMT